MRKIIHIDMDAFYASVEQRDRPELRGLPLAVGYAGRRGVVMTASYEARKFGVGSAMASVVALERCPRLIFVEPRMEIYKTVSQEIREVFQRYTDLVEPLALDEAYLDVTVPKLGPPSATLIAKRIKDEILSTIGLTASAGIASNKFLAKLASGQHKPDGLTLIKPEEALEVVAKLPIKAFHGIGTVTARKMQELGIQTGADLRQLSKETLIQTFGKNGLHFYGMARGEDERPVEPNRPYKSISAETTFLDDLERLETLLPELPPLAEHVARQLQKNNLKAGGVAVKVKFANHQIITRRITLTSSFTEAAVLLAEARRLLEERVSLHLPVRLLGVAAFQLTSLSQTEVEQPSLF